ncbi:MAG TPA: DUF5597 domain-containing protein [Opitutaceae bacterium]|nr:DUF5597 domain-containing protein [Opitutaceae bacterium]
MKTSIHLYRAVIGACALVAAGLPAEAAQPIPHLAKRGVALQLVVEGKPYLVLAGETANTASSSLEYMEPVWPRLVTMNLNTVLVGVAWDWIEPAEGKFDFTLVDGLLAGARKNNLHLIFLWFGSWKNGISSFVPAWVKADQTRFPRVAIKGGRSIEVLSPFAPANLEADTRAYAAFLRHLRDVDGEQHTVIMIQMQNEVGVLGDSRDRSPAAEAAFALPVPQELMNYLQKNKDQLDGDLRKLWEAAGFPAAGKWEEVFGAGPAADECFMAWQYARYLEHVTKAGKTQYPLPVFTNTWIVQPEDTGPGDYPSGGPEPLVIDLWKAGAPSIDLNAPDIYLRDFPEWCARFHRPNNPLFVPESRGDAGGAANAFYAIGQEAAIGYSPFGIDNAGRLLTLRPEPGASPPAELESLPLPKAYAVLAQLAPLILECQAADKIAAAWLNAQRPTASVALGNYTLNVELRHNRRNPKEVAALGYGLFLAVGPDEYLVAANDIQVTFTPTTPGPPVAGLADVWAGRYVDGKWAPGRKLSGDDVLLDYKLGEAAAQNQSGSGLMFGPDGPTIQRVKLYRYR